MYVDVSHVGGITQEKEVTLSGNAAEPEPERSTLAEEAECLARLGKPVWPDDCKGEGKSGNEETGLERRYQELDKRPVRERHVELVSFPPKVDESTDLTNQADKRDHKDSSYVPGVPELKIVRHSPNGVLTDSVDCITIVFSKPMIPLGRVEEKRVDVTIEPTVEGAEWTWDDVSILVYRRKDGRRFPRSTKFTVRIPAQTKSLGVVPVEAVLPKDVEFTFTTALPAIVEAHPTFTKSYWGREYEKTAGVNPLFQGTCFIDCIVFGSFVFMLIDIYSFVLS